MIIGNNINQIALVLPEAADFFAAHTNLEELADGRYELGNGHFANVSTYVPRAFADTKYEAHNKYADIQMVFQGAEFMDVAPRATMTAEAAFNEADDYVLGMCDKCERVAQVPGAWCLVMSEDAHRPGIAPEDADGAPVRKIVFKMLVD